MPTCDCCLGEEFDCIDGIYICTGCNTQSQGFQTEVNVEEMLSSLRPVAASAGPKGQSKAREKESKILDFGRPWSTNEMFACILREQIRCFIELGAKPEIKEIALKVFALYLKKCGTAFCSNDESAYQKNLVRQRDKYSGNLADPRFKNIRSLLALKKKNKLPASYKRQEELRAALSKEEFYDDDDPVIDDEDDLVTLKLLSAEQRFVEKLEEEKKNKNKSELVDDSDEDDDCSNTRNDDDDDDDDDDGGSSNDDDDDTMEDWIKGRRRPGTFRVTKSRKSCTMGLSNTLAILFISSRYTNSDIQPHDIIKWVKERRIPYHDAVDLVESDMKLCQHDYQTYCWEGIPSPMELLSLSNHMVNFMGLKTFPLVNLNKIAERFIEELRLPHEVLLLVKALMKVKPPSLQQFTTVHLRPVDFSLWTMAYIIIVLKLYLGLDDVRERKISQLAQEISKLHKFDTPLFIWSDWMVYINSVMSVRQSSRFPSGLSETRHCLNMSECFTNLEQKHSEAKYTLNSVYYTEEAKRLRDQIQGPLNALLESLSTREERRDDVLDEYFSDRLFQISQNQSRDSRPSQRNEGDSESRVSYRRSSLQYVTEPERFLAELDTRLYAAARSDWSSECLNVETPRVIGGKRTYSSAFTDQVSVKDDAFMGSSMTADDAATTIRKHISEIRHLVSQSYRVVDRTVEQHRTKPFSLSYEPPSRSECESYHWLLSVCSRWVDAEVPLLESYIKKIEFMLSSRHQEELRINNTQGYYRCMSVLKSFFKDT